MESLLRWGIENSAVSPDGETVVPQGKDLDPAIIDQILGRPDALLMKEALDIAVDEKQSIDARIQALDNFEMLVENIDNANDMLKLEMWEPLHSLLTPSNTTESIQMHTLWAIGTAIQNNPSAQNDYLAMNPVPTILSFLSPSVESSQLRSKAVYALSGLCKHNAAAVKMLDEFGGWEVLRSALEDSDISVRRKVVFLIGTLLIPSDTEIGENGPNMNTETSASNIVHSNSHDAMLKDPSSISTSRITLEALENQGLLQSLLTGLVTPVPYGEDGECDGDVDFEEKALRLICTYLSLRSGTFPDSVVPKVDVAQLKRYLDRQVDEAGSEDEFRETLGLSEEDMIDLRKAVT